MLAHFSNISSKSVDRVSSLTCPVLSEVVIAGAAADLNRLLIFVLFCLCRFVACLLLLSCFSDSGYIVSTSMSNLSLSVTIISNI